MKKVFITVVCIGSFTATYLQAQSIPDEARKATGIIQSSAGGASSTVTAGKSILSQLTPSLGLSGAQQPKVLDLVTGFLKQKAGILPLQQTNPAAYTSKFSGLQGGLFSKLKTILTAAQFAKFLGLKPKASDVTNVLSQLFF
ncbi:MAG TPA: hypothetical protein VM802_07145 [Chitinophaga sp.]|uniref:hypothetical protein n=1 Tax=Chitinophaga sp. TaxID=1869181 RepID=UPI002CA5D095|nr:hypothetical protein [Chitinophaga sp.]HVI44626.1 hypothetical protein [Chitinophaga sp.]